MENVVWDMFSFNFLQLSSTLFNPGWRGECRLGRVFLRFSSTLFNPGSCRGGVENVVWDAFFFNSLQLSSTLFNPGWCRGGVENVVWDVFSFNSLQLSSTFFNFLQPRVTWKMCSGTRFLQLWVAWEMWCSLTSVTLSFCASGSSLR